MPIPRYQGLRKIQSITKNFMRDMHSMMNSIFDENDAYLQSLCANDNNNNDNDIELQEALLPPIPSAPNPEIIEVHSYHNGLIINVTKDTISLADGEIFNLINSSTELLTELSSRKYVCIKYEVRTKNVLNIYPMKKSCKYDMKVTTLDNLMNEYNMEEDTPLRIYVNRGNICKIEVLHDKRKFAL